MELLTTIATTSWETIGDVLPIAAVLFGFQFLVIRRKLPHLKQVLMGFGLVILGLSLFLVGLDKALFPLGRAMAEQLTDPTFVYGAEAASTAAIHWLDFYWVYLFSLSIGIAAVLVEPAVIAVAIKAQDVSGGTISALGLRLAIAIGVGVGITLGAMRIVTGTSLHYAIVAAYGLVIVQTLCSPRAMIPIAYDSGGVSTSTVTVPLVTALGLGLASSIPGRSPMLDGFGLIAFAVLFPIISVLAYAQLTWLYERVGATFRKENSNGP
ncbi:MAG: DUF1538 domain-containing protein [Halomonadaceae bacterium]|nr:MAG: DUF1538 domain-containing protein [Halomonadaceae bacterium]